MCAACDQCNLHHDCIGTDRQAGVQGAVVVSLVRRNVLSSCQEPGQSFPISGDCHDVACSEYGEHDTGGSLQKMGVGQFAHERKGKSSIGLAAQ